MAVTTAPIYAGEVAASCREFRYILCQHHHTSVPNRGLRMSTSSGSTAGTCSRKRPSKGADLRPDSASARLATAAGGPGVGTLVMVRLWPPTCVR